MIKYIIILILSIILSIYAIPLQNQILNSKLKCIDYSCTECDNFLDGLAKDVIACAQNYITDTNEKNYLGFTPVSETIESDDYDCASFKVKLNPKNGLYEDDETKVIYNKDHLTMIIKDSINNKSGCYCTLKYIINND
ncbi:hypothetical protein H8356DRAFT_1724437 [Neocallimastix lanati (nom. inval.)]|uniref:Uncharacterized protein n=1 Tax=Neocallimastix californiae TaxID=1754190 RepID=A0A1Y2FH74_9FUNG|nr:hypothetical protein H8356DRAFT_1724437 [Neocallimastix sp. JGI-2020a]ORY82754.1 hypothetical protein LY90DRAFT_268814 [Neocallimastix californiae]|eukprot:ORY82754.1 hypothetical protein LY90DRAFT_268814 [Neocallimastix californiae]